MCCTSYKFCMIFADGSAEGTVSLRRLWCLGCEASNKTPLPCTFLGHEPRARHTDFHAEEWADALCCCVL